MLESKKYFSTTRFQEDINIKFAITGFFIFIYYIYYYIFYYSYLLYLYLFIIFIRYIIHFSVA